MSTIWLTLLLLFVGGLVLLLFEIFVIPGFGIAGVGGILAIVIAVGMAFKQMPLNDAILFTLLSTLAAAIVVILGIRIFPRTRFGKSLILNSAVSNEDGFVAVDTGYVKYVGKHGTVVTTLHPSGTVEIEGERLDVVSDGEFIEKGTEVVVSEVEGVRIVVRAFTEKK